MKAKLILIGKNRNKDIEKPNNKRQKKMSFSSPANSKYFFTKFSGIGPWVRIDGAGK